MFLKKIVSNCLRLITTEKFYINRHKSLLFFIYHDVELFFKTFNLRLKNLRLFYLPTKHLIAAHLYKKIYCYFIKNEQEFFLFGGSFPGGRAGVNAGPYR